MDLIGNYLTTGFDLYTWVERRQPEQRFGSELFKDWSAWQLVFTNVIVGSDGYGEWGYRAIVGDGLVARLSPLTLSKSDLNGLRVDGLSGAAVQDVHLVVNGEVRTDLAPHIIASGRECGPMQVGR